MIFALIFFFLISTCKILILEFRLRKIGKRERFSFPIYSFPHKIDNFRTLKLNIKAYQNSSMILFLWIIVFHNFSAFLLLIIYFLKIYFMFCWCINNSNLIISPLCLAHLFFFLDYQCRKHQMQDTSASHMDT